MKKQPKKFTLADVLWERDIWRHYYDGMDAVREKRLKDAEARFREIIQLNPSFPGSYEGLAAIAMAERNRPMTRKLTEIA
jgi:hypothetical protein